MGWHFILTILFRVRVPIQEEEDEDEDVDMDISHGSRDDSYVDSSNIIEGDLENDNLYQKYKVFNSESAYKTF